MFTCVKISLQWIIGLGLLLLAGCSQTANNNAVKEVENNLAMAQAAFDYAQFDRALSLLEKTIEQQPDHQMARLMLARTLYQLDQKQAAQKQLRRLLDSEGSEAAQAAYYLGQFQLKADDSASAIKTYSQGLQWATPQSGLIGQLHNGLAVAQLNQQAFDVAVEHFNLALASDPDSATFRSNLALCWLMQGDLERAKSTFSPLLNYQQLSQRVEMNWALLLLAQGKEQQAKHILAKYLTREQLQHDLVQLKAGLPAMTAVANTQ
ncbi:tetratricopeptide repeat protein [Motilimonas cestriensis]|uniref:Tetratricopeptide repeat protein n=1 Tax=Motilimonas cestriensis TaxID=2742685 RepID=A0ABS8WGA7_9GAMM|nr:tetratricopeptide repeat protein [Motilimonas cestriensis]MCE2596748.1 tetratricopeptide repeat protein [Motilimonas cestriensis]